MEEKYMGTGITELLELKFPLNSNTETLPQHKIYIHIYYLLYTTVFIYTRNFSSKIISSFFISYVSKLLLLRLCWYLHLHLICFLCSWLTYLVFQCFILNFRGSMRQLSIIYFFFFYLLFTFASFVNLECLYLQLLFGSLQHS